MLRLLSLQLALVSLAALSACASGSSGNGHSIQQTAREECEQRQTSPQDMDACMDEVIAALHHAEAPPPRQSPPPPPH